MPPGFLTCMAQPPASLGPECYEDGFVKHSLFTAGSTSTRPAVVSMLLPRKGVTKIVKDISMNIILNWTSADIQENYYNNLVWWLTLISLAVGRLKQEDC